MLAGLRFANKGSNPRFIDMVVEVCDERDLYSWIDEYFASNINIEGVFVFMIDNCPLTLEQLNEMPLTEVRKMYEVERHTVESAYDFDLE